MEIQNSQSSKPQTRTRKARRNPTLPQELIEEILSRLPVTSILRFRCVSKPWRSLLCSKSFIKKHLEKNSNRNRRVLLASNRTTLSQCSLRSLLDKRPSRFNLPRFRDLEPDFQTDVCIRAMSLVGCCNGLACVVLVLNRKRLVLWNPSTRFSKILPSAHVEMRYTESGYFYGLGYDEPGDDYKVFLFVRSWSEGIVCKLYSLKTNSWKNMNVQDESLYCSTQGKFVSGRLHWEGEGTYSQVVDSRVRTRSANDHIEEANSDSDFNCDSEEIYIDSLFSNSEQYSSDEASYGNDSEEGEGMSGGESSDDSGVGSMTGAGCQWDIVAFDVSREVFEAVEQPC